MAIYIGSSKKVMRVGSATSRVLLIPKPVSLVVTTPPNKVIYASGEHFDPTGMVITAKYSNNTQKIITEYTITNGGTITADMTMIGISYTERGVTVTTTYKVEVVSLSHIVVTTPPNKTTYTAGEAFDKSGMVVTAYQNDGTSKVVDNYSVVGGEVLSADMTAVTISYTENGVTKTTQQSISVAAIQVEVPNNNDSFVYSGAIITPTWSGYDNSIMTAGGDTYGINAGSYTTVFSLNDKVNYRWSDGTTEDKVINWVVEKAQASITLDKTSVVLNADKLSDTVTFSSVGMKSVMVMSSDMSVATVSMEGNVITISSVNETTGTANIVVSGEVDSNYNAPEYPSIEVSAEFVIPVVTVMVRTVKNSSSDEDDAQATFTFPEPIEYPVGSGTMVSTQVFDASSGASSFQVPVGTSVACKVSQEKGNARVTLNGTIVKSGSGTYNYVITKHTIFELTSYHETSNNYGRISITEAHAVSIANSANGTLFTYGGLAAAGSFVGLMATPDEGYIYGGATVTYTLDGVEQTITLDANTKTFTMPAADVTVTPVWVALISFIMNSETYWAEPSMTWAEWFASDYNTTGETEGTITDANGNEVSMDAVIVDGTAYEVGFGPDTATINFTWDVDDEQARVTIYATFEPYPNIMPGVTVTNPTYDNTGPASIGLPIGTVMEFKAKAGAYGESSTYIKLNGTIVVDGSGTYSYTVTKNASVTMKGVKSTSKSYGRITITET